MIAAVLAVLVLALPAAGQLTFESRRVEQKIEGCGDPTDGCVHVEFKFVELTSGPPALRDRVNAAIRKALVSRPKDGLTLTPEEYAKHFVGEYERVRHDTTGFQQRWSLNKTVKPIRTTPPVICLESSEWSETGGAHGSFATQYLNFDSTSGLPVQLSTIVVPGATTRLTAIAGKYFREARSLSPTAGLKSAGFTFPGGRFQLTKNFGVTEKELIFQYNSYEVGPYSMGPTTVTIPFQEIRTLVRPAFRR
jgi:hypothetical protein